jgi:arsenate reductase
MTSKPIVVYTYSGCGTCRKALKWLRENEIAFREKPIRETPPSPAELKAMLAHQDGELRRLFNTSGQDYRAMGLKDKLPTLTAAKAIELLAANGNLIKRPFLLGTGFGLVGFNESAWAAAFALP